jgi:hypothetical protein
MPGSEKQRPHVFFHTWEIEAKNKHIHKGKHDHIQIYMRNYSVELRKRRKGEEIDKASTI